MSNKLIDTHPSIAAEWDHQKNTIPLESVTYGSSRKVFWVASCGHSWDDTVKNRTTRGSGCPYCSGKRILAGYNDLATTHPDIAADWDDEKDVTTISHGSRYKASWKCEQGHSWEATVASRARGNGCPVCAGKKVAQGVNDLATTHPDIAALMVSRGDLCPSSVSAGANKRALWECSEGHRWEAVVSSVSSGYGCPVCAGQKPVVGLSDLATTHPEIAALHSSTNTIPITELSQGSGRTATWEGECGHSWEDPVRAVVAAHGKCPYCAGKRVLPGFNDMGTVVPESMEYWSGEGVSPKEIRPWSSKIVSWVCPQGHKWVREASAFTGGERCPYCSSHRVERGFNSMGFILPNLALQWHPTRNLGITPQDVSYGSGRKVWWMCEKGHEWEARVADRKRGSGCRKCSSTQSASEADLHDFVTSILGNTLVLDKDRTTIAPYELDLYIPDHRIAIEFNGLYWHSEAHGKDRNYHYNKWNRCKDRGIQLITIWEDDWRDRQAIVKNMLRHKLHCSDQTRIYARNTTIQEISGTDAREFLSSHHIQGFTSGSFYLALRDSSRSIVSVSVWKRNTVKGRISLRLERYATSRVVVGGMGKMLTHALVRAREMGITRIVTFADHCVSDGGLYDSLGFTADGEIAPDYSYLVRGERRHKFGYRLQRFKNDPDLQYDPDMTERELAQLNGMHRIWDCGKTRYVLDIPEE